MLDYECSLLQQSRVLPLRAPACWRPRPSRSTACGGSVPAPRKVVRYPGIKEEYALAAFEPDPGVPAAARRAPGRHPGRAAARRRSSRCTTAWRTRCSTTCCAGCPPHPDVDTVVLPRYPSQGTAVRALGLERVLVPEHAIDAQSLVAAADLVVSAGGTMNREAVVLGTPVYTGFAGRMGAVDERLIREGRLRRLVRADDVAIERKATSPAERVRRDPADWLRLAFD